MAADPVAEAGEPGQPDSIEIDFSESEPEPKPVRPEPAAAAAPRAQKDETPALLSPRSDAAVASAFGQLADTILSRDPRTLEDLVGDMLRPMLKDWLDDNLPALVEKLVREEIERVSRGRR
ncbi:PopZ family protein [Microbaculum sp. FT89]|uniref:PopZ family protein n=1 Tax=Microbaculum sp. FT89 TaxID=3447298 RepID=UPI003F53A651